MYICFQNVSAVPLKLLTKFPLRSSLLNTKWKWKIREITETRNLPFSICNTHRHTCKQTVCSLWFAAPLLEYPAEWSVRAPQNVFSARMQLQSSRKFLPIFPLYSGRSFTSTWTFSRMKGLSLSQIPLNCSGHLGVDKFKFCACRDLYKSSTAVPCVRCGLKHVLDLFLEKIPRVIQREDAQKPTEMVNSRWFLLVCILMIGFPWSSHFCAARLWIYFNSPSVAWDRMSEILKFQ